MAEKSSFFNARLNGTTYDRVYKAEDFANYFSTFIGNGVFANPTNNLQVVSNSGMTIILKSGKAFINGYFYENTEDLEITLDSANGTLKRIDRIVLRLDYLNREIKAYVLKGTPSSSAVSQDITRNSDMYEIALCDITVNSGVTEITQSNISDTRYNNSICGIVKGLVDEIDTTDLFNQFTTVFNELKEEEKQAFNIWFNELKNQLDNNQVTNLQNQLDKIHNDDMFIIKNLVINGDFSTDLTNNWEIGTTNTIVRENNIATVTIGTEGTNSIYQPLRVNNGNKVYYKAEVRAKSHRVCLTFNENEIYHSGNDEFEFLANILTFNDSLSINIGIKNNDTTTQTYSIKKVVAINLTEVFGEGNEPTKEEMDRIMTYYNGFIDDKDHLLDRNSKANTQFRENGGTINGETRFRGNIEVYNGNWIRANRVINDETIDVGQGYMRVGSGGQAIFGCLSANGNVNDFGLVLEYANNKKTIRPLEKNTHELGTESYKFKDLWLGDFTRNTTGYTKLPNGLILQWGHSIISCTANTNITYNLTFPIKFPNAILNAQCTGDTAQVDSRFCTVGYVSNTNFKIYARTNNNGNFAVYWIALGY